ncbi:MAG: hemerythrin domain-containing protein [Bacteroidota bacterium]
MKTTEQSQGRKVTDPIKVLIREHNEGLLRLAVLENAAESIKMNGFSPEAFEQIAETIRWMNTEVRRHTEIEEKFLFPLIDRHIRPLADQVRGEHRDLWDLFNDLLRAVKEVEEGRLHGTSIRDIVAIAKSIVELLRTHVRREDTLVFPAVKQLLTKDEYDELLVGISKSFSQP